MSFDAYVTINLIAVYTVPQLAMHIHRMGTTPLIVQPYMVKNKAGINFADLRQMV